jgi:hypothetical protein
MNPFSSKYRPGLTASAKASALRRSFERWRKPRHFACMTLPLVGLTIGLLAPLPAAQAQASRAVAIR